MGCNIGLLHLELPFLSLLQSNMSPRSEYATILFLREVFSLSVISHMEWKRSLYALWLFFLSGSVLAAVTAGTVRFFEQATKRELI